MADAAQLRLFVDVYGRCQNCGRGVAELRRVRRFWLCVACYAEVVPPFERAETEAQARRMGEFWGWLGKMDSRYPMPRAIAPHRFRNWQEDTDIGAFWPFCRECGAEVAEYDLASGGRESLFGKHRHALCPRCDAESAVGSAFRLVRRGHPEWDDEDALDWLYKHYRYAFDLGVLPGRWFELKREASRR